MVDERRGIAGAAEAPTVLDGGGECRAALGVQSRESRREEGRTVEMCASKPVPEGAHAGLLGRAIVSHQTALQHHNLPTSSNSYGPSALRLTS